MGVLGEALKKLEAKLKHKKAATSRMKKTKMTLESKEYALSRYFLRMEKKRVLSNNTRRRQSPGLP